MSYKNLQHYRYTVHRYLDAIWVLSSRKNKARSSMYKWLSYKIDVDEEMAHVKYFDRAMCRKVIKILRPMYIQLYGKDLEYTRRPSSIIKSVEKEVKLKSMYYSNKTSKVYVFYNKPDGRRMGSCWTITIYCKSKDLGTNSKVYDYSKTELWLVQKLGVKDLNEVFDFDITLENVAKWIWDSILPCYKVDIKTENGELVVYEEEKD